MELTLPFAIARSSKDFTFLYKLMDKVAKPFPLQYNNHPKLVNSGLSCAIDSVLAALFCVKCPFTDNIKKSDSELGKELTRMTVSSNDLCRLLENEELFPSKCRDPYEFLTVFLSRFPEVNRCTKLFQTIVNGKDVITSVVDKHSMPIQHISAADLVMMPDHFYISDLLHKSTENTFSAKNRYLNVYDEVLTVERLLTSPIIIFSIDRHVDKSVKVTETLTSPNGDMYRLGSVVVHKSGHFVTYYLNDDEWWFFDSLFKGPQKIGSFKNLPISITTGGVLYFYFPQHMSVNDYFVFHKTKNGMTVGVFEDTLNPKLLQVVHEYDSVIVSDGLFDIGISNKRGKGKTLKIETIDEYVKKYF